jgi:hypothetical protein
VNVICTWPVEVSEGVDQFWFEPLFGHSIAWPPEAAASFTTTKGENRLWPDRLSSSTTSDVPPPVLDDELELLLELLEDDELEELEELLEEDEVPEEELLELDEELEELLLEDEDELLEDELELEELEELLELGVSPVQVGAIKLPSCVPWKPKAFDTVWPGAGS